MPELTVAVLKEEARMVPAMRSMGKPMAAHFRVSTDVFITKPFVNGSR